MKHIYAYFLANDKLIFFESEWESCFLFDF